MTTCSTTRTTTVTAGNGVEILLMARELTWTDEVRAVGVAIRAVHPGSGARYEISRRLRFRAGEEAWFASAIRDSLWRDEPWSGGRRGGKFMRAVPLRIVDPLLPAIEAALAETTDAIAAAVRL